MYEKLVQSLILRDFKSCEIYSKMENFWKKLEIFIIKEKSKIYIIVNQKLLNQVTGNSIEKRLKVNIYYIKKQI